LLYYLFGVILNNECILSNFSFDKQELSEFMETATPRLKLMTSALRNIRDGIYACLFKCCGCILHAIRIFKTTAAQEDEVDL